MLLFAQKKTQAHLQCAPPARNSLPSQVALLRKQEELKKQVKKTLAHAC